MKNEKIINSFIQQLKYQRKSQSTIVAYRKDIEQLATSAEKDLTKLTVADIKKFISELKLTPKTVSRKINSIRTLYRYLLDSKQIKTNPALEIKHPRLPAATPRVLSPIEYLALREVSRDNLRLYTMIELILQTGLRIGEISRLKIKDLNLKKNRGSVLVKEFSTNPERTVELMAKISLQLNTYISSLPKSHPNLPLFATRDGKHIIIRNIRSSIDRAIDKAGIKNASVNDLRNTFIVYQLQKGVPVERITAEVGHQSKTTTMRYVDLLGIKYKPNTSSKLFEL